MPTALPTPASTPSRPRPDQGRATKRGGAPSAFQARVAEFTDLTQAKFVRLNGSELPAGQVFRVYSADLSQGVADFLIDEKAKEGALGHCISIRDDGVVAINALAMPAGYTPMGTRPVPPLGPKMFPPKDGALVAGTLIGGALGGLAGFGTGSPGFLPNNGSDFRVTGTLVGLVTGVFIGFVIADASADDTIKQAIANHPTIPLQ